MKRRYDLHSRRSIDLGNLCMDVAEITFHMVHIVVSAGCFCVDVLVTLQFVRDRGNLLGPLMMLIHAWTTYAHACLDEDAATGRWRRLICAAFLSPLKPAIASTCELRGWWSGRIHWRPAQLAVSKASMTTADEVGAPGLARARQVVAEDVEFSFAVVPVGNAALSR
jgi:hypothetical protein